MPAQSKSQQRLFGMALAQKKGKMKGASKKVKELAKEMSAQKLKEFAATKHKGLKEGFVLKFDEFINESNDDLGRAYVTPEGDVKNLDFTPEEQLEIIAYDNIQRMVRFFEDAGANNVQYYIKGGIIVYSFEYFNQPFMIIFDLDHDRSSVINRDTKHTVFYGSSDELLNIIKNKGFDFTLYDEQ